MLKDILDRIDQRLHALNLKEAAASKLAVGHNEAIRNIRRNIKDGKEQAGVSSTTLEALAPVLQTTAGWLIDGSGPEEIATAKLQAVLAEASTLPATLQDRIASFANFEMRNYKSRDTAA